MKVLILTAGSHGDVLPFIALGREFSKRGHEVFLYANPFFAHYATEAGLVFVPIGTIAEYEWLFGTAVGAPRRPFARVARHFSSICGDYYRAIKADVVPGQTIVVGSSLVFAHRLLRETDGVPCATVHLSPSVFQSNEHPARLLPYWIRAGSPDALKHMAGWAIEKLVFRPSFIGPLNRLRAELGLPAIRESFSAWWHDADCVIGMFPDWFAERPPDWPAHVELTGFPLYDHGDFAPLPESLKAFLDAGPPPVAFTAGTATSTARSFFEASVAACRLAGLRAILLAHFADQVPDALPNDIIHVPYAPFGSLLPRLAALVHHGGIGTTAQALRAGVPQLIRPVAYDQFDNAERAVRLGTAAEILKWEYRPRHVAATLRRLVDDPSVQVRCAAIAERLKANQSVARTCDILLARLGPVAGRQDNGD